jgi:clan AA aspartic protease
MISGRFERGHPRVELAVDGESVEFVIDTGFEGDLALPAELARRLCGPVVGARRRMLADGRRVDVQVHEIELPWQDEDRLTEVLVLEGTPLLGTVLLEGHHLHVEVEEGGEVLIEPID